MFRAGEPVPITPKALELLELLIEERARTLSKSELLDRLWPDAVVAENNLSVTMSALRKALGESAAQPRFLQTLSRRGYRFVAEPPPGEALPAQSAPPAGPAPLQRPAVSAGPEPDGAPRAPSLPGRDAERARLGERFARAVAGTGHVVFVTGEPGIGKTALCESFVDSLAGHRDLVVMRGRCLEQFGRGEAYLPWLEAWGGLLRGAHGEPARRALSRAAPSWCRELPAFFAAEASPAPAGELDITRDRLVREMADAFVLLAEAAPLLVVLEDLHWADAASCSLLRWLSQRCQRHRWLIVGTFRSVEAGLLNPPLESLRREALAHGECDELRLGALAEAHVRTCVAERFAQNEFPSELGALLHQRTEGHPLFLTRLLSFLAERGDLVERDGVWRLVRELDQLVLEAPEDVRGMVRKKLDSLDAESRSILAQASVVGQEFGSRILAAVSGIDELELEEQLQPLCSAHRLIEVLGEETGPDRLLSTRYRFAHALYQNELYDGLVSRRRVLLHQRTAELLLAHAAAPEQRARIALTLAFHFECGRDPSRAIEFLALAAENAHRLCAYAEAERHYNRGIELCVYLPEPERSARAATLYLPLGWARNDQGQAARAEQTFRELVTLAHDAGLGELECEGLNALYSVATSNGRLDESRVFAERARELAIARGDRRQQLISASHATTILSSMGQVGEAGEQAKHYLELADSSSDPRAHASLWLTLGWVHGCQSDFAQAEAAFCNALALWREVSKGMWITCLYGLGWVRAHRGLLEAGLAAFAEGAALAERHHIEFHVLTLRDGSGWIRRELGDRAGALAHHRARLERIQAHAVRSSELNVTIDLARDATFGGDLVAAEEMLRRADALLGEGLLGATPGPQRRTTLHLRAAWGEFWLARRDAPRASASAEGLRELAAVDPSREHHVVAQLQLASAASLLGDTRSALAALDLATGVLDSYPMPLLGWRVHALQADLHGQHGDSAAARQARARARQIIDAITSSFQDPALAQQFRGAPGVREVLLADAAGNAATLIASTKPRGTGP